jgi:hypothetical protein
VAPAINKWGVHLLLDDGVIQWPTEVWEQHLAYARQLVGENGFVVQLVRSDDLDVAKWGRFVDDATRYGLRPILRLATYQDRRGGHWVAPDKDAEGATYHRLARRYAEYVRQLMPDEGWLYVSVGNEPNRGDEWGGRPNPAEYAQFLLDVANALHRVSPRISVLNAALDLYAPNTGDHESNGLRAIDAETFLRGMLAHDRRVFDAIDAWASHAYPLGPFAAPPTATAFQIDDLDDPRRTDRSRPPTGLANRGVNAYKWELHVLRSLGVERRQPVFVTETGWRHADAHEESADSLMARIPGTQAASYVLDAFGKGGPLVGERSYTPWTADEDVVAVALFALGGHPARWGHSNLVDIDHGGRILGFKAGFAPLVKP